MRIPDSIYLDVGRNFDANIDSDIGGGVDSGVDDEFER